MGEEGREFVSIIVPVRNEEKHLAKCLQAILEQDYPSDRFEVLVVDGLSTDRTSEIAAQFSARFSNIRLLKNPKGIVSAAMNMGIKNAKGEVIVRVDGHSHIERDYITQCLRHLRATGAQNVGGPFRAWGEGYVSEAIAYAITFPFGIGNSPSRYAKEERYVDTVYLGAFPRHLFDQIGLYDERLVRNQDYELNYRIRAAGGKILCTPAIRSRYYARENLLDLAKQHFQYGFWKWKVIRKHPRSLMARHLVPPLFVLALLATGLLAPSVYGFLPLFLLILLSYLAASLLASLYLASQKGWSYLIILPWVFASIHLGWGLGFIWSLVTTLLRRGH